MKKVFVCIILTGLILSGCGTYTRYQRPDIKTDNLYREVTDNPDSSTIASLTWREMFTDCRLQSLIGYGIENNTDLNIARQKVVAAQAALANAKLLYLPSAGLAAEGGVNKFGDISSKTYNAGLSASWEIDVSGKLTASKRGAMAAFQGSKDYEQMVQSQLVAIVAQSYYTLELLDAQLSICSRSLENWQATVRTLEALKKVGKTNEAGVLQAKASVMHLELSQIELQKSIYETENALSAVLAMPFGPIERGKLSDAIFTDRISVGVPLQLLSNRPDVRMAEMELAQAFYATNVAQSAFYPGITLSGALGWTNNGGVVTNPAQWLLNAVGSLTQPLFNRGTNIANLRIAKSRQEEARLQFAQRLLDAGKDVNNALVKYQTAERQIEIAENRVNTLKEAVRKTEALMKYSSETSYLEVLTAQQTLLDAEMTLVQNSFERIQGLINLYHALGGGL